MHLMAEEVTIAEVLKASGYQTALFGKYHCNGLFNDPGQPQPGGQGFDHWMATQNNAVPSHRDPENFVVNGQDVGKLSGFSATILVEKAIE